jgi:hypothetical protein
MKDIKQGDLVLAKYAMKNEFAVGRVDYVFTDHKWKHISIECGGMRFSAAWYDRIEIITPHEAAYILDAVACAGLGSGDSIDPWAELAECRQRERQRKMAAASQAGPPWPAAKMADRTEGT